MDDQSLFIKNAFLDTRERDKNIDNQRIFISYSREDMGKVIQLYNQLKNAGFYPWMVSHR